MHLVASASSFAAYGSMRDIVIEFNYGLATVCFLDNSKTGLRDQILISLIETSEPADRLIA